MQTYNKVHFLKVIKYETTVQSFKIISLSREKDARFFFKEKKKTKSI